jgi:hypothetical protein
VINLPLHSKHKLDVIAHALTRCGITIWHGIPEQIVTDLHVAGYKIKKRKSFKRTSKHLDSRMIPAAKLKAQHEENDEIYL